MKRRNGLSLLTLSAALALSTIRPTPGLADDSILNLPPPETAADLQSIFDLSFQKEEPPPSDLEKFFEDSTLKLFARNFYFNRGKPDALDSIAWAQGGWLSYQSGKLADLVTLAAEYQGSFPLSAEDEHDGTLLLEPVQDNIDVLAVANARFDFDGNILSLYRQKYDLPYVNQQDNRMLPNTFEGYTLAMPKTSNPDFQYAIGYIDQIKTRNSDHFVSMSDAIGATSQENGLFLGGLRVYPLEDLSIAAIDYYLDDILNFTYVESVYKIAFNEEVSDNLSLQYSDQLTVGDHVLRGDEYTSNFWGIQNAVSYKNAVLRFAFNQTDTGALMRAPFGSYPGYTSSIVEDFNRAGEASWLVGLSYGFGRLGLKDLSINTSYISGSGAIDEVTKSDLPDKNETDVTIDYKVSEGSWKGFWVRGRSGTVDTDNSGTVQDFRLIVNYEFVLYEPPKEPPTK